MAYDDDLVNRIRELLEGDPAVSEKRMFGGLAFLINGHMAVAASSKGGIMVRVEPSENEALLARDGVRPMEMQGRELKGWLRVDAAALAEPEDLGDWVERGVAFARALPPKPAAG